MTIAKISRKDLKKGLKNKISEVHKGELSKRKAEDIHRRLVDVLRRTDFRNAT